ncbi:ROK family transcriptional regulator [Gracilibacillus dipsosauri]|uniref:ROK family transcriptional regulator n=1 Tax=Gracilibacillus dipsosauri TaxID=178340 RepID=UPI0024093D18
MKNIILFQIRQFLLEHGSATKVELRDQLDISFPTISKFLDQMEKDGEVISAGLDESSGGRRPKRYTYNPNYRFGLAIFLEKNETNYILYNSLGETKIEGKAPSVLKDGGRAALTNLIESLLKTSSSKVGSIAIGVPGAVQNGKIFYIPGYEEFEGFDIKGSFEKHFGIPVVVENDMNAAVLGFSHKKKTKDNPSYIYLYLGQNGPGAGYMINGDVVRGKTFFAGEVSFVPFYNDRNFGQTIEFMSNQGENYRASQLDAISRLVATFGAMLNPQTIIFSKNEMNLEMLNQLTDQSSKYIPKEHIPELTLSDWEQDYLQGLQLLGLDLLIKEGTK